MKHRSLLYWRLLVLATRSSVQQEVTLSLRSWYEGGSLTTRRHDVAFFLHPTRTHSESSEQCYSDVVVIIKVQQFFVFISEHQREINAETIKLNLTITKLVYFALFLTPVNK